MIPESAAAGWVRCSARLGDGGSKVAFRSYPHGPGPTWISGLVVLADPSSGRERLFASYAKIRGLLESIESS